ncbi:MAG: hypothetical protein FJX80_09885 [Bacteroidetes bacterium]|nr:hypothetical protein [Bacteroidota bacterium]
MKIISEFSLWVIAPLAIFSLLVSIYFYRKTDWLKTASQWKKLLLIGLRSISIFLVLILLLGLTFQFSNTKEEKPIFLVLIDNSLSMKNYKDSTELKQQVDNFLNSLRTKHGDSFDYDVITCGSSVDNGDYKFTDKKSNLEAGFNHINSQYYNRNIGGIAFISDGNFNEGSSPLYAAEKISLTPIFSLGVGDTTPKRDQAIKHVSVNDIAFLSNDFPVEVDISSFQFQGMSAQVSIFQNEKKMASQTVSYSKERSDYQQLKFLIPATKIGFQRYTVVISPLGGEFTLRNNKKTFYVEVMDTRSKVVILSHAPHPDISAIKNALETNDKLEVLVKTFAGWDKNLDKVDLVIVHEPGLNHSKDLHSLMTNKGIPQLFIIGPNSSSSALNSLSLGVIFENTNQSDDIQGQLNNSFNSFELSDEIKKAIDFFPPLKSKFGVIKTGGNIETLVFQRIGQVVKQEPLIFFKQQKLNKNGFIFGEGIWRWKLNEYLRSGSHGNVNELIAKISNYLMVKQEGMGLRVLLNKRFTSDESIIFNASFYNASLEAIVSPKVNLTLTDQSGKKYESQFGVNGNSYKLDYGQIEPGRYDWEATCVYNGKIHRKAGTFLVEEIDLEKTETTANHKLLEQLSNQSNGNFYNLKNYERLIADLDKRDDIVILTREELSFKDLIHLIPLLILLAVFFTTEWFVRRWSGSY